MSKKDSLGDRMKSFYEDRFKTFLPRRAYTLIRIDGKAFHTYTRGLKRPFDIDFVEDMDKTAMYLCQNIMCAKFAYVQSDEISILMTDFDTLNTDAWFNNNLQKMVSVSASMATSSFNKYRLSRSTPETMRWAEFDSRVFQIPSKTEVENYFIWRQQDATRNSISSLAQSMYSHKQLLGKSSSDMQELCFQKGVNWNDLDTKLKRGRFIDYIDTKWQSLECPVFTKQREFLSSRINDL